MLSLIREYLERRQAMRIIAEKAARFQASDRFANVMIGDVCFLRQTHSTVVDVGTSDERTVEYYSWKGDAKVEFWQDVLEVHFSSRVAELSPATESRILSVLSHSTSLRDTIEGALVDYYQQYVLTNYETDDAGNALPTAPKKRKLRSMFGPPDLYLDLDDEAKISLYFHTSWDVGRPVNAKLVNWQVE